MSVGGIGHCQPLATPLVYATVNWFSCWQLRHCRQVVGWLLPVGHCCHCRFCHCRHWLSSFSGGHRRRRHHYCCHWSHCRRCWYWLVGCYYAMDGCLNVVATETSWRCRHNRSFAIVATHWLRHYRRDYAIIGLLRRHWFIVIVMALRPDSHITTIVGISPYHYC